MRRIDAPATAGLQRINWDLRGPSPEPIDLDPPGFRAPWAEAAKGPLVAPGRYTATLMAVSASGVRTIGTPQSFEVKPVKGLADDTDFAAVAAFQAQAADLRRQVAATAGEIGRTRDDLRQMRAALLAAPKADAALFGRIDAAQKALAELARRLNGDPARQRLNESTAPSIGARVNSAMNALETTGMPTATQRSDVEIAGAELAALSKEVAALRAGEVAAIRAALEAAGAPWTPRRQAGSVTQQRGYEVGFTLRTPLRTRAPEKSKTCLMATIPSSP